MAKASTSIKWSTEIYAPFPYQIELVSGECFWFYDAKGQDGLGFYGHAGAGWKIGGVDVGLSPSNKVEIPLGVNLTWLSHTERKYYNTIILNVIYLAKLLQKHLQKNLILKWIKKEMRDFIKVLISLLHLVDLYL